MGKSVCKTDRRLRFRQFLKDEARAFIGTVIAFTADAGEYGKIVFGVC